jgi:hypothetical protein
MTELNEAHFYNHSMNKDRLHKTKDERYIR